MKKSWKYILLSTFIALAVGAILLIVGILNGGVNMAKTILEDGDYSLVDYDFDEGKWLIGFGEDWNDAFEEYTENRSFDFDKNDVENLTIDVAAAEVYVMESDASKIKVDVKNQPKMKYKVYVDDETLHIKDSFIENRKHNDPTVIELYIPKGTCLNTVSIDVGAAKINVDTKLDCEEFNIDMSAGAVDLDGLKAKKVNCNLAAGAINFANAYTDNVDISVSMGEVIYRGDIEDELNLDCSMGDITMELDSSEGDHNYECSVGMGKMRIGNIMTNTVACDREVDNGANSNYNIDCSMGSVDITFAQNV